MAKKFGEPRPKETVPSRFQAGDVVRFVLGGPLMRVAWGVPQTYRRVHCQWFNEDHVFGEADFPEAALELVTQSPAASESETPPGTTPSASPPS